MRHRESGRPAFPEVRPRLPLHLTPVAFETYTSHRKIELTKVCGTTINLVKIAMAPGCLRGLRLYIQIQRQ